MCTPGLVHSPSRKATKANIRLDACCVRKRKANYHGNHVGGVESAGINRHGMGDARAPHERRSCSIMAPSHARVAARLHVKQLTGESAGQPLSSEITHPGCRPSDPTGKATLGRALRSESSSGPAES